MQAKNNPVKQTFIAILLVLVIVAVVFSAGRYAAFTARAAGETTGDSTESTTTDDGSGDSSSSIPDGYRIASVDVSNSDFGEFSGDMPASPTSWTAGTLGGTLEGSTVDGVVDLDPSAFNGAETLKNYRLDIYDEFSLGIPLSPFGRTGGNFLGSDSNALMINSAGSEVAYGYTSSSISLSANSYYKISAWVKTGNFAANSQGATIKVSGLKNPLTFEAIDTTLHEDRSEVVSNYGWVEYTFYIETSTMTDSSITISLQLGDAYEYEDSSGKQHATSTVANGYAFFDHITAYQYSPNDFEEEIATIDMENPHTFLDPDKDDRYYYTNEYGTSMFYSENDAQYLAIDADGNIMDESNPDFESHEIGSFDNGLSGWEHLSEYSNAGVPGIGIFDRIDESYGIDTEAPHSPNGVNDTIFVLGSYNADHDNFDSSPKAAGYASDFFTVERYKNYRISVWVKTENGTVASAAVYGYDYRGVSVNPDADILGQPQLFVSQDLSEGDSENTLRMGWRELSFYVKGSAFADYKIRLELWLGQKSIDEDGEIIVTPAAGVAMFDNVRIEEITSQEYTDYSGGGQSVTFDADVSTGSITNGNFDNIEVYEDYREPFVPSSWTLMSAGEDETTGMSTVIPDEDYEDYFVSGVVSSAATSYEYERPDGSILTGTINPGVVNNSSTPSNLLMMKADDTTGLQSSKYKGIAAGYRSSSFSISSESVQRVDIVMKATDIKGYGANLVLKSGTNVIASIEQIKDTSGYETFTFYVQTGGSSLSEVYVEIWLGLYDRNSNTDKLASGTLFVESVSLTNMSESSSDDSSDSSSTDNTALTEARNTYSLRAADYQRAFDAGVNPKFAVYSNLTEDFTAFDRYSDDFVKPAYNWTENNVTSGSGGSSVVYGIFDSQSITDATDKSGSSGAGVYVPDGYQHNNADNRHSLIIKNTAPASSRIRLTTSYSLASGSYYTITVKAKVDIPNASDGDVFQPDNYKGAYIGIADTEYCASDIKSTADVYNVYDEATDNQEYKEFTFYIHTSGTAESDTEDDSSSSSSSDTADTVVTLEFGIGGDSANRDEWAIGTLMINSITVEECGNLDFEEAQDKVNAAGPLSSKYTIIADYTDGSSGDEEEEDTTSSVSTGDNWYVYMTIILAVVIIIVLIAVAVRYYGLKRKRENVRAGAPTYDRERTLVRQHNKRENDEEKLSDRLDSYDMFDEDEEDRFEEEQLAKLEAEELARLGEAPAETESGESDESAEAESTEATETAEDSSAEQPETTESGESAESPAPAAEPTMDAEESAAPAEAEAQQDEQAEAEEEYKYSEEIVDFTPSEEKKKELEAKKAEAERIKAEKEEAKRLAEEARARAEAEKREANRRYNKWDDFDE